MTSMVMPSIHCVDGNLVKRLFEKLSFKYGKLWTTRLGDNPDWEGCAKDWLSALKPFTVLQIKAAANKAMVIHPDYPPTQGQIVELCRREAGIPAETEIPRLMSARDFIHPVVKMIFDKIGSWSLSNGRETLIKSQVKEHYAVCLSDFFENPEKQWEILYACNKACTEVLPQPEKMPTPEESKSFSERMTEYKKLAEANKQAPITHPEFPMEKVQRNSRYFDQQVFETYRKYLINLPESQVQTLPVSHIYARTRFLTQIEASERLEKEKSINTYTEENKTSPRAYNEPTKIYKHWASD